MVLPDLEPADLEPAAADEFAPSGDLELRSFADLDLSGRDGSNGRLLECAVSNCRADGLELRGATATEVDLRDARLGEQDGVENLRRGRRR